MPKIKLSEPWTYRTPLTTISFPAGEHTMSDEVAAAVPAKMTKKENANGDRPSKTGASGHAGKDQG